MIQVFKLYAIVFPFQRHWALLKSESSQQYQINKSDVIYYGIYYSFGEKKKMIGRKFRIGEQVSKYISNLFFEKSIQQINFPSKVNVNIKFTKK